METPDALAADRLAARQNAALPAQIGELRLDQPLSIQLTEIPSIGRDLQDATGPQEVIVRLKGPSVAKHADRTPSGRISHKYHLKNEQAKFISRAREKAPGAKALGSVQTVLNAVFLEVDASQIQELATDPEVLSINRVKNYEMDLSETVPYISAAMVQDDGFDGSGVRVAVLDSGIDYYHQDLGGSGNPADYAADDPTIIEPGTFPTAKVVGGFDFVGSLWPTFGPVTPDPDPLDDGPAAGHGTHVADIIGGNLGVAPGVDLYAVKVCSSVSSSCSGIALINGMDFAVDPDGDGDPSDAVDIINMSLGSSYGQPFDDDLSAAVEGASAVGVLTVASAGNSSDKPYATGTPSASPSALSVAQTQVPSATIPFITVAGKDYQAVFQPWSVPVTSDIGPFPVQYGDGTGGNLNGCAAFAAGSLTGKIVLVDRGACNFTLKIKNIGDAGGELGIIGLIAPGAPFAGGDGGDSPITIPGFMISQADSNAIKGDLPAMGGIDLAKSLPLVMQMVGSSSRGPQHEITTLIKPEIGAPGASVSANAGAGTGRGPFGGTSGASPMVAGSAALLLEASPGLSPAEVKARLMNTGETEIQTDPLTGLAPITRIGGGEVRAYNAFTSPAAAWDDDTGQGALSFGFGDFKSDTATLHKMVRVRNYSDADIQYTVTPTFRFANDEASGAVVVDAPKKVKVKAHSDKTFPVKLTVNGPLLPGNFMNSGSQGANPAALTANEFDGYLVLDDGSHPIHLAWHLLPRKAANVVGRQVLDFADGPDVIDLTNNGVGVAQNDAYSLLAVSPNKPEGGFGQQAPAPDIRAVGVNTFPVPAGFCSASASFVWVFAINTWERQQHLLPVSHQVLLDTNQDGTTDFVVLNRDLSGLSVPGLNTISDGRQVTIVINISAGTASVFFFAEHATNTGNTVLTICGEQVGLSGPDILATNVNASFLAQDFYYGGPDDSVGGLTITPLGERYVGIPVDIAGKSMGSMTVVDFGPFPGNTPELGVMLFTNGDRGSGARGGATQDTEALLFLAK